MAATVVRGGQVKDGTIQRVDLDTSTVGQAVVAKLVQGAKITLSSTGGDAGTGDVTVGVDQAADLAMTAAQTVKVADASNAVLNVLRLSHNYTGTPTANNEATAIEFEGKSDTTVDRAMAAIVAAWSTVADATRTGYLDLKTTLSGTLGTAVRIWGSNGMSVNNTTDPGAGFVNVPTAGGYKINNALFSVDDLATTATNDAAVAGEVGETVSSYIASSPGTSYTSAQTKNLTSISLTAGDWDVRGTISWSVAGGPLSAIYIAQASIGTTTGTFNDDSAQGYNMFTSTASSATGVFSTALSPKRISLASTTTVYLVGRSPTQASGTCTAWGFIEARRIR